MEIVLNTLEGMYATLMIAWQMLWYLLGIPLMIAGGIAGANEPYRP